MRRIVFYRNIAHSSLTSPPPLLKRPFAPRWGGRALCPSRTGSGGGQRQQGSNGGCLVAALV